ncbi:uncharacterized protein N7479_006280 [Penicillium vulpinum]|uniref:Uncharacterized protein n=1 Tax=Penicillium vulpinum TaxID=29845 RepID=A0A1V6R5Q7_9EURO|nr:uncharacterized protein N7479_006280 [Penicillium vulpinum]KAJ5959130.1 hypothetical protein N7479_006280 [Penicillium vulpinum]OQD96780.1 hypothetical protein PENVUL_c087G05386 [Penicillium vulpinum]
MAESTAEASFPMGPPTGPLAAPVTEPLIVFVARGAPTPTYVELGQLKYYLRPALLELKEWFERKYGKLEEHPYCYCPLIHKSVTALDPDCDSVQSLTDILVYGRTYAREIVFVFSHWDSITSDTSTFANIFKDFTDVKVTIRVFGVLSADHDREFHSFDAHKVSAHYQGLIKLGEQVAIDDALRFVVRLEEVRIVRLEVEQSMRLMVRYTGVPEVEMYRRMMWMF